MGHASGKSGWRLWLGRGLLAAVLILGAPALSLAQSFTFNTLDIQGTQRVDDATVAEIAGIARGTAVGAGQINQALQNLQNSGLFETVEVVPRGSTLVIRVEEFPTINRIAFEGNRRLSDEDLQTVIQSRVRRVYSPAQAETDAAIITEGYRQQGRIAATVTPRIIRRTDNRVDLVFEIVEGRVTEVERVSFVGNRTYSERRLRGVVESKQAGIFRQFVRSDTLIEDRIAFDRQLLSDFYQSRGFVDFQVLSATPQIDRNRDSVTLVFNIREGQQFRVGTVGVTSDLPEIDPQPYVDALKLREGVVYSPTLVERDIARLERLAVREGRDFVRVEPRVARNDRDLTLDIEFVLTRGPRVFVERIDIEGNTTTLDRVIRRQFNVVEGDPFNPRAIRASAERIEALGYFTASDVQPREGTAPDQVIIDVDVEEQPTGSLGFGASLSTNAGLGFSVSFAEANFLGRGQRLSADLSVTEDTSNFGFNFVEPAFLGRDLTFGLNAFYREAIRDNARFDTRRALIAPRLAFPLSEATRLEVRTALGFGEVFDVDTGFPDFSDDESDNGSSAILRDEEDLGGLYTYSVGYALSYDSRRIGLDPTAGVSLRFSQDVGYRSDDATFVRSEIQARARRTIFNEDVTLRAEFDAGAIAFSGGDSRVTDRFSLSNRMRGFAPNGVGPRDLNVDNEDVLGGNFFAVARFEADFPIGIPEEYGITGGIFYDVGSVWSLDNTNGGPTGEDPVDDDFALRSSAGVSLFWDTILGPLRFNFSRALQKEDFDEEQNFEFTVSTRF
ncbi:MAG: outer membrane protein assembly factor BamA [Pseudomonadota bacterium]